MSAETDRDTDPVTGTKTTGHEWDGVRELNTPLPRWWLWMFYLTIIWSVGYWVVYPSWPLVSSYSRGIAGWNSREAIEDDLAALRAQRGEMVQKIAAAPLGDILNDAQLLAFARAQGRTAFVDNCAPCHGAGGGGAKGYPNLNDDDWLWGGKIDEIAQTIRHGVRAADENTHNAPAMPAFGRDGMLQRPDIDAVAEFVRSLAKLPTDAKADLARGAKIFAENCAACHGEDGKGMHDTGAPNLTDAIWLFGSDKATIVETLMNGRGGVMPAWAGRLDDATIKALAVYVHTLGGGQR